MLLTPHALVGASIGASTENLALIIILAFLSHFVLDALPHFDWGTWHNNKEFELELKDYILVTCDGILMLLMLYWIWTVNDKNDLILVGSFFAVLTDLIDNVPFWKHWVRKIYIFKILHQFHKKIHYKITMKYWYWGVITQLVIILVCWNYLLTKI